MTKDLITHEVLDPVLGRVLDKIDERIRLYNTAIDNRVEQLHVNREPGGVAHIAAELARYGAAKAELVRLKELL